MLIIAPHALSEGFEALFHGIAELKAAYG